MTANPFSLEGKRILVTGASSGIGAATAMGCAMAGAEVVVTGRDVGRLTATLLGLPGAKHSSVEAELTNAESRSALVRHVGVVDGIVHSAGVSRLSPIRMATPRHLEELWKVNYEAPVLLTQAMLAKSQVANGGSIMFIASIAALIGVAGVGAYSGSKAALIATMRCLAMEVVKRGIRVNCLAPALVETPLLVATESMVASLETQRAQYPLGFGKPDDVANACVFYLSEASRWITGTTLTMDGGLTIS